MSIARIKGIEVVLGGETFVVPPIALGALEQLQDRIAAFNGDVADARQIATVIDSAHAALRRNYPAITREEVAELIDVSNMADVFEAVMDVSGLKRKALEAIEGEFQPGR